MYEQSSFETDRGRLRALLAETAKDQGMHPTSVDGVKLARADRSYPRSPVLYEPSVCIIASGRKKGYIGDRQVIYDANNYLVLSIPLPFECEVEADDGPVLGVCVRMDSTVLSELAMQLGVRYQGEMNPADCFQSTPVEAPMMNAAVRLVECLRSPVDATVLGPAVVREIAYYALRGPQGKGLLATLGRTGPAAQIQVILHRIHTRYAEPINVERLALEVGMSISSLHHHFKAVTSSSPVQYLKSVRLHKARMLMMLDGLGAALAADRVGYESPSQFSREFKRFFGSRPSEDIRRMRELLGLGRMPQPLAQSA